VARALPVGMKLGAAAFAQVARSTPLRRAQLSFGLMWAGEWALTVGLGVFAFREGGAAAVGAVMAVRMIPAALMAPFAATVADAVRRELILVWIGLGRAVTLGAAAVLLAVGGPTGAVYGLAIVATIAQTLYRPAHSALLPALCTSPQELTSASVVRGMLDSVATLGGPLVATVLLATSGVASVFAACAAASLVGGLVVLALPYDQPPRARRPARTGARAVLQGFSTIRAERGLLLITGLGLAQTFTRGCLSVFSVVVAIELLDLGEAGVGVLNAAVGAGAVLGSILTFGLVRRGGLAAWFGLGIALFGAPLVLLGVVPEVPAAIALFAVVGIGNALIDVGGFTMLARLADEAVLARMFAAFEATLTVGIAAGALLTPLVIELLGIRVALVAVGLVTPIAVVACWAALRRLDARMRVRDADIELLHNVPMLRALPQATIEQLAAALDYAEIAPEHAVFEQGDPGEHFYVVEAGCAEVVRDGRAVETLRRGECFGEIALLRDSVRTASVSASANTPLRVGVLPRNPFLTAVTGYPASAIAGERVVTARLEALAARPEPSAGDSG
jgi:Cyclic nucleotide-binding domain/Major Facilitator Superfamily